MDHLWDVELYIDANLQYNALLLRGLTDLRDEGKVRLTLDVGLKSPTRGKWRYLIVALMRVRPAGASRWATIAYDPQDFTELICETSLETAERYFKVNYYPPFLDTLRPDQRAKIRPTGISFPMKPFKSEAEYRALWPKVAAGSVLAAYGKIRDGRYKLRTPYLFATTARTNQHKYRVVWSRLHPDGYKHGRDIPPVPGRVLFIPRAYQLKEWEWAVERLGEVVRKARAVCEGMEGASFVGGFRRSADAERLVPPELWYSGDDSHHAYMQQVSSADIVINSRRMWHALSWKLPEYLAAGRCIISPEFASVTVEPLRDEEEILYFKYDLSDFEERLAYLLSQPALRDHMRQRAAAYYDAHVAPPRSVERLLRTVEQELF